MSACHSSPAYGRVEFTTNAGTAAMSEHAISPQYFVLLLCFRQLGPKLQIKHRFVDALMVEYGGSEATYDSALSSSRPQSFQMSMMKAN